MTWRWLLRAAMWVRRPPSPQRIKMFVGLVVICIVIGLIEYFGYWPEWATLDRPPRVPRF